MAFVVPGVARFAINQQLEGRKVVNVLDMQIDTTGSIISREDAVFDAAGNVLNQWVEHILPFAVDDLSVTSITWVDLDEEDGSTGERVSTSSVTLPVDGSSTDAPLPANASMLVTKQTTSARGKRNGRMYLAGHPEGQTDTTNGNVWLPARVTGVNAALAAFLDDVNVAESETADYASNLVVVHILTRSEPEPGSNGPGAPLTGDFTTVSSLVADPLLATQRRRLRR